MTVPTTPDPAAVDASGREVVAWSPPPSAGGLTGFVERASRLGLGVAGIAASAAVGAVDRFAGGPPPVDEAGGIVRRLPGAALGVGLAVQARAIAVAADVEATLHHAGAAARHLPGVSRGVAAVERSVEQWHDRAVTEQTDNEVLVVEFVRRLAPELATAVMNRLDIEAIVSAVPIDAIVAQVDVDGLISKVDVDGIISRVDIGALLERVDIDAMMSRVDIGALLERVDVDQILERVDLDKVLERVDIEAMLGRVDLAPMITDVLDVVDIGALVRESTGSVTGDLVDTGRIQAMKVDGLLGRLADAILLRKERRELLRDVVANAESTVVVADGAPAAADRTTAPAEGAPTAGDER